jgi:hypothetical protein
MIDTETLAAVAREELTCLWHDLDAARRNAYHGEWSMACDSLVDRIKALTPLVGPTPWGDIQIPLLESGIYQRVHAELGIDVPEVRPDMAKVAELRAHMGAQAAAVRA